MGGRYFTSRARWGVVLLMGAFVLYLGFSNRGRRAATAGFSPFLRLWRSVFTRNGGSHRSAKEVLELERQLEEAKLRMADLRRLQDENLDLRSQLELGLPADWRPVAATVVSRDPATWNWELQIDKGRIHGIAEGAPVVFRGALLGKVVRVFNTVSTVATIASPHCRVSVFVINAAGEKYPGLLQGCAPAFGGERLQCQVDCISKTALIKPEDAVVTSGLGTDFPFGLPVGGALLDVTGVFPELVDQSRARLRVAPLATTGNVGAVTVIAKKMQETRK